MRQLLLAPVVLAVAALAAPAHAAITLKLSGYQVGATVGTASSLYQTLQTQVLAAGGSPAVNNGIVVGDERAGLLAGTINVDGTGDKSFAAFCVELTQGFASFPFSTPVTYTIAGSNYFSATVTENIGRLYSQGITFDTAQKTAAFQIALWEVIYEKSGFGVGTSTAGNADFFINSTIAGSTTVDTFNLAQGYLTALPNTTNKVSLTVYTNATSQDLIVATPIPEPGTYAMMLAGLAGIGFVGMRRARQQG